MLQEIRDGIKGWIAWVIIGLIALPFIFMGGSEYLGGGGGEAVVAKVDGEEIPRARLEQAVERQRTRLREMFGGDLPEEEAFEAASLRREALEQLIDEALLNAYVHDQGLRVSDAAVARRIRDQEIFQEDGAFSRERYQTLLERNRLTPADYEGLVRRDLQTQQLEQAVLSSSLVTDSQLERLVRLRNETRDFAYVAVPAGRFRDEVTVQDAAVEARYEAQTEAYMAPEAVRLAYVELGLRDLRDQADIDEADLRERYAAKYGDAEDAPAFGQVRAELETALLEEQVGTELATRGEELGNLAFEHPESLEPAAEALGLEVQATGWIDRDGEGAGLGGIPEVVEQAFSEDVLESGHNSGLIQPEEDRYLVVRVREHREAAPRPLSAVEERIRETLRSEQAAERARQRAEALVAAAREGRPLADIAAELGTEVATAEDVQRRGGGHPGPVVRRAFALEEGGYGLAELGDGAAALVRLDAVARGDPGDLSEQERAQLERQLRRVTGESQLQALIGALRAEAEIEIHEDRL